MFEILAKTVPTIVDTTTPFDLIWGHLLAVSPVGWLTDAEVV